MTDLEHHPLVRLAVALLIGLMIGIQRGWVLRDHQSGQRIAGVRTFTLISLLGAVCALIAEQIGAWFLASAFLSLALILGGAHLYSIRQSGDHSITGLIAGLLTFCFGVMCQFADIVVVATLAVVTTIILDIKDELHRLLKRIQEREMDAALKLLVMTVIMLPLLPNQGYGPWEALNPYEIWWMVVLIASISFIGHFAVKIAGTHKGIMFTSLFAGLSSSTALSLHYARLSRVQPELSPILAGGILVACATMFPRVLFVCYLLNPSLAISMALPLAIMTLCPTVVAVVIWYRHAGTPLASDGLQKNPLEISAALLFGGLLTTILLLSHALQEWLGDQGIYMLAVVSGITDVDAINLSLSRLSQEGGTLSVPVAALGIVLASSVNTLVKAGLAIGIGTRTLGLQVVFPLVIAVAMGLLSSWLL